MDVPVLLERDAHQADYSTNSPGTVLERPDGRAPAAEQRWQEKEQPLTDPAERPPRAHGGTDRRGLEPSHEPGTGDAVIHLPLQNPACRRPACRDPLVDDGFVAPDHLQTELKETRPQVRVFASGERQALVERTVEAIQPGPFYEHIAHAKHADDISGSTPGSFVEEATRDDPSRNPIVVVRHHWTGNRTRPVYLGCANEVLEPARFHPFVVVHERHVLGIHLAGGGYQLVARGGYPSLRLDPEDEARESRSELLNCRTRTSRRVIVDDDEVHGEASDIRRRQAFKHTSEEFGSAVGRNADRD